MIDDYVLRLTFDDGTQQTIDFKPILLGPLFGALSDLSLFKRVCVNPDTGTIEWLNGADLNPSLLYEWPKHRDRIIAERQQKYAVASNLTNS